MMKGVAILLMIFLHLFNNPNNVELCHNLIYINGKPLVEILSRATNPVAFFLILGGYGLYRVNIRGDKHRWGRILKLFIHYWTILLVFVSIGHFMYPESYPGSLSTIIANITSFHTTYNGEMWFLCPYVILSLVAPLIFRLMIHIRSIYLVSGTLLLHLFTSFCISKYGETFLYSNYLIYNLLLVIHLMFSFVLGAVAAKERYFERVRFSTANIKHINLLRWGG